MLAGGVHGGSVLAENPIYELDPVVVVGEKGHEEGQSEQAYYRTGGDVTIVSRQEIEERHYANIKDAIKRIPGVQISGPGYHAHEYGTTYSDEVTINGDRSVIIMVDGKRLDNQVSSYAGNKSKTSLDMITNIANVERIEVLKGASSSVYGADATGGVINIITRKGTQLPQTTLDLATGSWGKHNYAFTHSGSAEEGTLRYFLSLNREQSGDTYYKDAQLNKVVRFLNTRYQDNGASFRLDKQFDQNNALNVSYSHTDSLGHYPITAPAYSTLGRLFNDELYQDKIKGMGNKAVGYRNWFLYDALLGSYTQSQTNDYSVKYTYLQDHGMESFVRLYQNHNRYLTKDYSGLFGKSQSYMTPENIERVISNTYATSSQEDINGIEFQYAKKLAKHSLITGWDYKKSSYESFKPSTGVRTYRERDSVYGFLQDKIQVTDKWVFTPAVRYNKYNSIQGVTGSNGGAIRMTYDAQTEYQFDKTSNMYFSLAQVYRPISNYDYDNQLSYDTLEAETGKSWAVGFNKTISLKTSANVNYGYLDMSNAIARYSVWDTSAAKGKGDWATRSVNATQKKKALNVGFKHEFSDTWGMSASYAYVMENFHVKNWRNNPDDTNVDALINNFRPPNIYQMEVMYHKGRWSGNVSTELYSGLDTRYYTNSRFLVVGLDVNYDLTKDTRVYFSVDNLTNIAYETKVSSIYTYGAFPQPSRSFLLGVQYKF